MDSFRECIHLYKTKLLVGSLPQPTHIRPKRIHHRRNAATSFAAAPPRSAAPLGQAPGRPSHILLEKGLGGKSLHPAWHEAAAGFASRPGAGPPTRPSFIAPKNCGRRRAEGRGGRLQEITLTKIQKQKPTWLIGISPFPVPNSECLTY